MSIDILYRYKWGNIMKHRTKLDIVHGICWLVFLSSLFTGFPGMDDYNPEYIGWVEKGPKQKINRARSQPLLKLSSLPYLIILSQVQWPLIFSHLYLYLLCLITPFGNSQWNMNRLQMIYEDLPTNKCWFSVCQKNWRVYPIMPWYSPLQLRTSWILTPTWARNTGWARAVTGTGSGADTICRLGLSENTVPQNMRPNHFPYEMAIWRMYMDILSFADTPN